MLRAKDRPPPRFTDALAQPFRRCAVVAAAVVVLKIPSAGECHGPQPRYATFRATNHCFGKAAKERANMPIEREVVTENVAPVMRETIIENGAPRSVGSGIGIGIIVVIFAMLLVGGFTVFNGGFSFGGKSVTLDVPKVTISK